MNTINKLNRAFRLFRRLNIFRTILFNFKMLPFRQAVKLPIYLFGKVSYAESTGKIKFKGLVKRGSIRIGHQEHRVYGMNYRANLTVFNILGTLEVESNLVVGNGSIVKVEPNGILRVGSNVHLGPNTKLYCDSLIEFGNTVICSWECQIFDTDFHFMVDGKGVVENCSSSVSIGSQVWIGNRVTINKGSMIPDNSIVASNTLINKDLREFGGGGIFAGIPAKYIPSDKRKIFNYSTEKKLFRYFHEHIDERFCYLNEINGELI